MAVSRILTRDLMLGIIRLGDVGMAIAGPSPADEVILIDEHVPDADTGSTLGARFVSDTLRLEPLRAEFDLCPKSV